MMFNCSTLFRLKFQAHEQMNLVSSQQVLYKNYELKNKMINLIIIDQIKRMKPKIV